MEVEFQPSSRRKNIISGFLAILILAIAVFVFRGLSSQKKPPPKKETFSAGSPEVAVLRVKNNDIPYQVNVQGDIIAFEKIDVTAEVTGVLQASGKAFKEGSYFEKGSILLQIDSEEAHLNLLSQKSTFMTAITQMMPDLKIDYPKSFDHWQAYLTNFSPEKSIQALPEPATEQERMFVSSRNLYTQYYAIRSAEARLKKYTVYAPFNGVITQSQISPGGLVRSGQMVGTFMNNTRYEVQATLPLKDLKRVRVGNKVQFQSEDLGKKWTGKVKRISDQIDAASQSALVYLSISGSGLREGMYVNGDITVGFIGESFEIPVNVLQENMVMIVRDSMLALQPVEIVRATANTAIIKGVADGELLVAKPLPGAYEGMMVRPVSQNPEMSSAN